MPGHIMDEKTSRYQPAATGPGQDDIPPTPDPLTMAVRADVLGENPGSMARAVLERQAKLIQSDVTHRNWQIAREAAGAALMILAAVSAFTAVVIVAGVLWSATQYRGLTIQPFSVPPALEERGLTGAAVASRVLDRLAEMQSNTQSMRAANTYADSWGDEVAVEIPQTGVSAGELWRFLRSWLGEEIRITGELVREGEGYRITARAGGQPARVIMAETGDIYAALDEAADAIFAQTQPYRYAVYLLDSQRSEEAREAFENLLATGTPTDRRWAAAALAGLHLENGELERAAAIAENALELYGDFGLLHANLAQVYDGLGEPGPALRHMRLATQHLRGGDEYNASERDAMITGMQADLLVRSHQYQEAVSYISDAIRRRPDSADQLRWQLAYAHIWMYDTSTGTEVFSRLPEYEALPGWPAAEDFAFDVNIQLEDTPAWQAQWPALQAAMEAVPDEFRPGVTVSRYPVVAVAFARAGELDAARALLTDLPGGNYFVDLTRAYVDGLAGDLPVDHRFDQLIARAPELAYGELFLADIRRRQGDADAALTLLAAAHRKIPQWADPLKEMGDVLAAEGQHRAATRRYRQAAQRAPHWGALHLAWGQAEEARGRTRQALDLYQQAALMDLSAADREAVEARLAALSG
jgi:tetratricopeptide (TPR) repeat protein